MNRVSSRQNVVTRDLSHPFEMTNIKVKKQKIQ